MTATSGFGDRAIAPVVADTDEQLQAEIAEIDRVLDSQSSWLTPRCRMALLTARDVVVGVLERRRERWHAVLPPSALVEEFRRWSASAQRRSEH
jgi:hypothetical protein